MTASSQEVATIRGLANRMAALTPQNPGEVALLAFAAGTLYALSRAAELRFDDARMTPDLTKTPQELRTVLAAIGSGTIVPDAWLSGFHVDSAMMRLAALNERIDKYLGQKRDLAQRIRQIVNDLKHDIDAGIASGWKIKFADVLKGAEDLCGLLEQAIK